MSLWEEVSFELASLPPSCAANHRIGYPVLPVPMFPRVTTRYEKLVTALVSLFLALSVFAVLPPVPPGAPNQAKVIHSPKDQANQTVRMVRRPLLIVNPSQPLYLTWDYPLNPIPTNIVFEVWHTRGLTNAITARANPYQAPNGWTLLVTVPAPPVRVGPFLMDFFITRALDTKTGLYSVWNQ